MLLLASCDADVASCVDASAIRVAAAASCVAAAASCVAAAASCIAEWKQKSLLRGVCCFVWMYVFVCVC